MSVITNNPVVDEDLGDEDMAAFIRDARTLAISGGRPYILITVDPETAEARMEQYGFQPDSVGEALREVAEVFESGAYEKL